MNGFDKWLENNPFEQNDETIEEVSENLSDEFFRKNENFCYSDTFYKLCEKATEKQYFVNSEKYINRPDYKKVAIVIERLFKLYKLEAI